MPHIHDEIEFTVALFIVHDARVLLVHHRALDKWLRGHIELDEDPEAAALREESGLPIELLGERPPTTERGTRALVAPRFLDIHRISNSHEHIGMIYFARVRGGDLALSETTAAQVIAHPALSPLMASKSGKSSPVAPRLRGGKRRSTATPTHKTA